MNNLLTDLLELDEGECLEFKSNNTNPEKIGEYISALANSAALHHKDFGYLVWGVADNKEIVGTNFIPTKTTHKKQPLELWLNQHLQNAHFRFECFQVDNKKVVILQVNAAARFSSKFNNQAYIRVGSTTTQLSNHPQKEKALWSKLDTKSFELGIAKNRQSIEDIFGLLDTNCYAKLLHIPPQPKVIIDNLVSDKLICKVAEDKYDITNMGAILLANKLSDFEGMEHKAIRVIFYDGNSRVHTKYEQTGGKGYAAGFEGLINYLEENLPKSEHLKGALRQDYMYPIIAIRELIANALTHQDFSIAGMSLMVEVFDNCVEITNPGAPLVDTDRLMDMPPYSRNEKLAGLMRRMGICEQRGSGIDKVISYIELSQLPSPEFVTLDNSTKVIVHAYKQFNKMNEKERVRAAYWHSVLQLIMKQPMTNTSLRERFGIELKNSAQVSRVIKQACNAGKIVPLDETVGAKARVYIPAWAKE